MTADMQGSWSVEYKDGTVVSQYDKIEDHNEVPFAHIDWPQVKRVLLESQWAKTTLDIPEEFNFNEQKMSLRYRHFQTTHGNRISVFMFIVSKANEPISKDTVDTVFYWLPDGTNHQCDYFWCSEVADYCTGMLFNREKGLMPGHHKHAIETQAALN